MNLIVRKASVRWKGGTRALQRSKFFLSRPFKSNVNTDPAEWIAAAHAKSFLLALAGELGLKRFSKGEILATATVTREFLATGWTILKIHLDVVARLSRVTQGRFIDATVRAKTNCLISRLLRANISMNAKLVKAVLP
ncbi:MAG: osmC [Pedosphaera sp.]|nr:osmC [Pedosphaera sp.]